MGVSHASYRPGGADSGRRCPDCLSDVQLRGLIGAHGTPLLLIDCLQVRANYRSLRAALPEVAVHYAIKALPQASVLRTLHDEGCNFDVASTGELELLLDEGVRPERIIHTHPIKTDREIRDAFSRGCRTFVYDNPDEIAKFEPYRDRIKLILRVAFRNPDATVDLSKKFGAETRDVVPLIRLAQSIGLQTVGLSFHVGSQCADSLAHVAAIQVCERLIAAV